MDHGNNVYLKYGIRKKLRRRSSVDLKQPEDLEKETGGKICLD